MICTCLVIDGWMDESCGLERGCGKRVGVCWEATLYVGLRKEGIRY